MYDLTPDPMAVTAAYSLAAFLIGVLTGSALKKGARKGGAKSGRGSRERVEIYAGNLSYDVNRKDLLRLFTNYGEVASARIIKNRVSGKSKGYGFLDMIGRHEAAEAIRALNGKEIKGRKMVVNEAKSNQRNNKSRGGRDRD